MKRCIGALIGKYGQSVTVKSDLAPSGRAGRAMLMPVDTDRVSSEHKHARPGIAQPRRYLLIAPAELLIDGEHDREIIAGGHSYCVMRAEPIMFNSVCTHWECVLRRKDVPGHD